MLRLNLCFLTIRRLRLCFLTLALPFVIVSVWSPPRASSNSSVVRLTTTVEQAMNLNPSLSDDGRVVVFESSANFFGAAPSDGFHAIRADVGGDPPVFVDLAKTRIVSPALSANGNAIAFSSTENLVGQNADRNSEIYLLTSYGLKQLTHSSENLWSSIAADGGLVAFTANGNPCLYEVATGTLSLISEDVVSTLKLSGDGLKVYYQTGDGLVSLDVTSKIRRIV